MRKREAGFSVLELLIIGGIIAILTAIAIVGYTNAINRARQKKTVNDIRVIAQAWEQRASDTQSYQVAGFTFPTSGALSHGTIVAALSPTYLREIPSVDGWRRPLQFGFEPGEPGSAGSYAIRSAGRDGAFETAYTPLVTNDPDCDIVWANGNFVVYPDVMQGQ